MPAWHRIKCREPNSHRGYEVWSPNWAELSEIQFTQNMKSQFGPQWSFLCINVHPKTLAFSPYCWFYPLMMQKHSDTFQCSDYGNKNILTCHVTPGLSSLYRGVCTPKKSSGISKCPQTKGVNGLVNKTPRDLLFVSCFQPTMIAPLNLNYVFLITSIR